MVREEQNTREYNGPRLKYDKLSGEPEIIGLKIDKLSGEYLPPVINYDNFGEAIIPNRISRENSLLDKLEDMFPGIDITLIKK